MSGLRVLVTGATGNQGGAVARHLLKHGAEVHALTRNPTSPAALALQRAGAKIVQGDFLDTTSLDRALKNIQSVFSVQDFWAKGVGYQGELAQGINLANAALRAKVAHFVQSGMAQGHGIEGIEHFESKQAICAHIKAIGLPHTIIGTVYFMDNLLYAKRGGAMTFPTLAGSLHPTTKMHMLAVDDLGAIVAQVLLQPDRYLGQHIDIASDCLTVDQMKATYQSASGRKPKSWALPAWLLRLFNRDFAKQLAWQNNQGWSFSIEQARTIHPALTSFEQFIKRHHVSHL